MKTQLKYLKHFTGILALLFILLIPAVHVYADDSEISAYASYEVTYSTDGGTYWELGSLMEAIQACYAAPGTQVKIKLLNDIVLDENWTYAPVLGKTGKQLILDGNGHTITRGAGCQVGVFSINESNSEVILKNITIDGGAVWSEGSPASRTNSGISLDGGYYLFVVDTGTLILDEGTVLQNSSIGTSNYGAAVAVSDNGTGGTLIMKNGSIIRNNTALMGGGVWVGSGGTFKMEGGTISGNYGSNNGGGVIVNGNFQMTGGEISENYAAAGGGGVTIMGNDAAFSMSGGKIINNQLTAGNNLGGGVLVHGGKLSVSGTPVISGNKSNTNKPNNVFLNGGKTIHVSGELQNGAQIGVTASKDLDISSGFGTAMNDTSKPKNYFFSDNSSMDIIRNKTTNEAQLHEHTYDTDYVTDNNATCTEDGTKSRTCTDCNEIDTVTDPDTATGHIFSAWKSNQDGTHTRICDKDSTHTETENCSGDYVTDNNATCTKDGTKTRTCTDCNEIDTVTDTGSAKGHAFGSWTANQDGTHTRICANDSTHTETENCSGDYVADNNATCTKDGTKTRTCSVCNAKNTVTDTGSAKGHAFGPWISNQDSTHTRICANDSTHTETENCSGSTVNEAGNTICTTCGSEYGHLNKVAETGENAPQTEFAMNIQELADAVLTTEDLDTIKNGSDIQILLTVNDAKDSVSDTDKTAVTSLLADKYELGQYLDISLFKVIDNQRNPISQTASKIRITITIPETLKNTASGKPETFAVARVHDGETMILNDLDNDDNTITIETDRFSTYAIIYERNTGNTDNGNTGSGDSGNTGDNNSGSGNLENEDNEEDWDNSADGTANTTSVSPRTGDNSHTGLYLILMITTGFSMFFLLFRKERIGN